MKKSILFLACASLLAGSAAAQDAKTLFDQGKAAIEKYDKMNSEYMILKAKDPNAADATATERAGYLMEGIKLLNQALPLDTVIEVDKKTGEVKIDKKTGKPKFKVKYSKDIQDMLVSHTNDLVVAGNSLLQANDFANSFVAYGAFMDAINNPLAKERGIAYEEASIAEILFYQGYSAYQTKDFKNGYKVFDEAIRRGYKENSVVDYKNSCVANIIQALVDANNFSEANSYCDNLLSTDASGFNYDMKGFVVEREKNDVLAAEEYYKKSMDLGFANGIFDYGRLLFTKAQKYIDANPDKTTAELAPTLTPMLQQAKDVLTKANEAAPESSAATLLGQIDYQLEQLGAK